jgi:hypothetical protein
MTISDTVWSFSREQVEPLLLSPGDILVQNSTIYDAKFSGSIIIAGGSLKVENCRLYNTSSIGTLNESTKKYCIIFTEGGRRKKDVGGSKANVITYRYLVCIRI